MQRYYQQVNMTLIQAGIDRQPFSTILNFQMVSAKLRLFVETCPTELYGLGTLKLQLIASGTTKNRKSMPVTDNSWLTLREPSIFDSTDFLRQNISI